jgi:hypothetical protein
VRSFSRGVDKSGKQTIVINMRCLAGLDATTLPVETFDGAASRATVPPDLAAALEANPRAARFFETLESYNGYAVLLRVHTAKKPETRAMRIAKFVEMLARHEKVHP